VVVVVVVVVDSETRHMPVLKIITVVTIGFKRLSNTIRSSRIAGGGGGVCV